MDMVFPPLNGKKINRNITISNQNNFLRLKLSIALLVANRTIFANSGTLSELFTFISIDTEIN